MEHRLKLAVIIVTAALTFPAHSNGSMGRDVNVIHVPTHHRVLKDLAKKRLNQAKAKAKSEIQAEKNRARARAAETKAYKKRWKID